MDLQVKIVVPQNKEAPPSSEESLWKAISTLPHWHPRLPNNEKNKQHWDTELTHPQWGSRRQCLPLGLESEENQKQLHGSSPVQAAGRPQLCLTQKKQDCPWFSEKESKKNNSDKCTCLCKGVHTHVCKHVCAWGYIYMCVNMFMHGGTYTCLWTCSCTGVHIYACEHIHGGQSSISHSSLRSHPPSWDGLSLGAHRLG